MRIERAFSPITLRFDNEDEWRIFRNYLEQSRRDVYHKRDWMMRVREPSEAEQTAMYLVNAILTKTE